MPFAGVDQEAESVPCLAKERPEPVEHFFVRIPPGAGKDDSSGPCRSPSGLMIGSKRPRVGPTCPAC